MSSSISSSDARRFLGYLVACLLLGSSGVVAWNYVVDPYDMWHGRTWHGFNHFKSRTEGQFNRMAKAHEIRRLRPDVLILGTSRADWGMDADHPGLLAISTNTYNAALAGASIYELYRYLQHAHHYRPIRAAVLGLDIELFNLVDQRDSFREQRLAVDTTMRFQARSLVADRVETLFTQDALAATRKTLSASRDHLDLRREELLRPGGPFREDLPDDLRWAAYRTGVHQARDNLRPLGSQRGEVLRRLEDFNRLLAFCHQQDIDLYLYISPYHLSHLEILRLSGNWPAFETWKEELVKRNEAVADVAGRPPFPLWDFSGYHRYATEPHPSPDDPYRIMTWYRDSSHFRKITGDRVLDRVLGRTGAPEDFGRRLDSENLDTVLAEQHAWQDAFLAERDRQKGP